MYHSSSNLAYAPTTSSLPYLSSTLSQDEEIKVAIDASERDLLDSLAEIYSIIRTLDGLEKAYQKDALSEAEYNEMCGKMLKQYKSLLADENVATNFGSLEDFMRDWSIEAPRAGERLRVGLTRDEVYATATARPAGPGGVGVGTPVPGVQQPSGGLILAATENFITFLDALRLNMLSKSSLHPLLSDVIQSVNKVTDQDFENRGKIIQWLITLNGLRASEELSEDQAQECGFDIERAYQGFKGVIG